jgi:ribosome-associated protein
VRDAVRSRGMQVMRTEGEENGEWIIVDCGAAVVHIMQPAIREYYHLEEIWGGKAVKMKLGDTQGTRLVKASEEPPHAAEAAVSARYMAPAKKAPARKRATARRPATPREAAAPGTVRKVVVGKPTARKSLARKVAAPRGAAAPKRRA